MPTSPINTAQAEELKKLQSRFEAADNCADVGEKYIELTKVEEAAADRLRILSNNISPRTIIDTMAAMAGMSLAMVSAAALAAAVPFAAVGMGIGMFSFSVGFWDLMSEVRKGGYVKKEDQSFARALQDLSKKVRASLDKTFENDIGKFAMSKYFNTVMDKFPKIQKAFMQTAAREKMIEIQKNLSQETPKSNFKL